MSLASILFGASRLTPKVADARTNGSNLSPLIARTTASFANAIVNTVGEQVKTKLYDMIREHDLSAPHTNFAQSEGNVLFKAEDTVLLKPFVEFRNPVNDEAQRMIQMISALHTSRLAAFGYTEEAQLLGVTEYMINEQLDNKICPVCEIMHGKTFYVRDARDLLERTLSTDDPEALSTLQPWPSQNKASVAALRDMSDDDILARGWHIPPYHPWCRGQLVKVGELPRISDTGSFQAAFPTDAMGDFSPEQIDVETFQSLGIDVNDLEAEAWNTEAGVPPADVLSLMTGMSPQDMADEAYDPIKDTTDSSEYGVTMDLIANGTEEERLRAIVELEGKMLGLKNPLSAGIDFVFEQFDKLMHIKSLSGVGKDNAPEVMKSWVAAAALMGIDRVEVDAELDPSNGLWSEYGGMPDDAEWQDARQQLKAAITGGDVSLTDTEMEAVQPLLNDTDTEAFWQLVDLDIPAVDEFLASLGLSIIIDLTDEATAARFADATG
jgi:hypothetical protein